MEVPKRTAEAQSGTGAAAVVLSRTIVIASHFRALQTLRTQSNVFVSL